MSYWIRMYEREFRIKSENVEKAFKAVKNACSTRDSINYVLSEEFLNARHLAEMFDLVYYELVFDEHENVTDIIHNGEKDSRDEEIFEIIAPFVEDGSYLEYTGEDGDKWRLCFDGGKCFRKDSVVLWNNELEKMTKFLEDLADKMELNGAPCSVCDNCERTYPQEWIIDNECPFCFKEHTEDY